MVEKSSSQEDQGAEDVQQEGTPESGAVDEQSERADK